MNVQLTSRLEEAACWSERAPSKSRLRARCYIALAVSDAVALAVGFVLGNLARFGDPGLAQGVTVLAVLLPMFWGMALTNGAYCTAALTDARRGVLPALLGLYSTIAIVLFVGFLFKASTDVSRLMVAGSIAFSTALLVLGRLFIARVTAAAFGGEPISRVLITDGADCPAPPDVHRVAADDLGLTPNTADPLVLDRLGRYLEGVDSVVVACAPEKRAAWATVLKGANIHGELTVPELDEMGGIGTARFGGTVTMLVSSGPLGLSDRVVKRTFDLALVIPTILFLAPLLLLVACAVRLDSAGPALFLQQRVGRGNKLFFVHKFRSMYVEQCDSDGTRSTDRHDNRVTRVGRFIRALSLDELPQLFNILKGEMSFVGPRPHALGSLAGDQLFWEIDPRYWHRHACKPGLTGLAQVRGFRGATLRREDLINRLQADLEYLNGWTVWRDLSILLATVKVVVHRNAF